MTEQTDAAEVDVLAEILGSRKFEGIGHALAPGFRDLQVHCICGWASEDDFSGPSRSTRAFADFAVHQARALLASDWLAAREAAARAEALRDLTHEWQFKGWADVIPDALNNVGTGIPALVVGQAVTNWLRARAAAAGGAR